MIRGCSCSAIVLNADGRNNASKRSSSLLELRIARRNDAQAMRMYSAPSRASARPT
jgi:hypothetical protein